MCTVLVPVRSQQHSLWGLIYLRLMLAKTAEVARALGVLQRPHGLLEISAVRNIRMFLISLSPKGEVITKVITLPQVQVHKYHGSSGIFVFCMWRGSGTQACEALPWLGSLGMQWHQSSRYTCLFYHICNDMQGIGACGAARVRSVGMCRTIETLGSESQVWQ